MQKLSLLSLFVFLLFQFNTSAQDKSDWEGGVPEGCTTITVGKAASFDGSVMTSHTDDSHRTRSWMDMVPAQDHAPGAKAFMYKRVAVDTLAMPIYGHQKIGEIPQVKHTYGFLNTAYPAMNEHQLAIGESTFGGRDELQSDAGIIDCQRLVRLMLERTTTARDAIRLSGELLETFGWNDVGECLTIADTKEVWHLEIVGPGKGKVGAVWVAQRVPDNHIAVNANASTIKHIDLKNKDFFMASDNIYDVAKENGWFMGEKEDFQFCYAYAPHSRESVASRRREWRTYDLLAPSLHLDPNDKDYPFSVKPDTLVTLDAMVMVFKDYYQGTPYDMRNNILAKDKDGKQVISPLANPFMPYDQLPLHNVSGGWYHQSGDDIRFLGERTIARWYTMYGTITQSRGWLPDAIGGKVWLAQDNIATSIYIPVYCGITHLPDCYATPGRVNGYTRESAWWAFNRLGTLTAQRWGDMHQDVDAVWEPWQKELFEDAARVEKEAQALADAGKTEELKKFLTDYTNYWGNKVVDRAWKLGDELWTKYDEKF
jgi:dipeptidase